MNVNVTCLYHQKQNDHLFNMSDGSIDALLYKRRLQSINDNDHSNVQEWLWLIEWTIQNQYIIYTDVTPDFYISYKYKIVQHVYVSKEDRSIDVSP